MIEEKDVYTLFAEKYENDLKKAGSAFESGFILFCERFYGEKWEFNIERICVENSDLIFENDFFEGQECEYISSITDIEIKQYMIEKFKEKKQK